MRHNIILSGSKGNAVLYHDSILIDCGLPFQTLKPYISNLQLILLTHIHMDHINIITLGKLQFQRPTLRIGCCEWMYKYINMLKNIDVYTIGNSYDYGRFKIIPVKLYHDVENCGYRILTNNYKIFHATDTAHLEGITAKDYDLYSLECNYDEEVIDKIIEKKEKNNEFVYQKGSKNTHLSEQQAMEFYIKNRKESSELLRLHESEKNY